LIWQGGLIEIETDTTIIVAYNQPYPKKVLTILLTVQTLVGTGFTTSAEVAGPNLVNFGIALVTEGALIEVVNVYWMAVGY
jgi:hypothetical protein